MSKSVKGKVAKQKPAKPFPLEKIISDSVETYCASVGRNVSDYTLKGVIYEGRETTKNDYSIDKKSINSLLIGNFIRMIPEEAEMVVNFRPSYGSTSYGYEGPESRGVFMDFRSMATGTALIRKKKRVR